LIIPFETEMHTREEIYNLIQIFFQNEVSELLYQAAEEGGAQYQSSCGVPYTALPLATVSKYRVYLTWYMLIFRMPSCMSDYQGCREIHYSPVF
jgi:hypothetical protein